MNKYKGKLITFEGSEGSGKSTQIALIREYLNKYYKNVMLLREPGGVKISEDIRGMLLDVNNKDMCSECETLLYMAARAQLIEEVLKPELKKGTIILCDRFLDSTIAYQGYGNGVDIKTIKQIGKFATQGISPDLTLIFDIDAKKGLARINREKDRIELRKIDYHRKVQKGYLELAKQEPKRVKVVRVDKSKEEVFLDIKIFIDKLFKIKN